MGGEHLTKRPENLQRFGSSPHGRGTRPGVASPTAPVRFIPTWAGNTSMRMRTSASPAVHPRMGGEHLGHASYEFKDDGSSPHGRGTRSLESAPGVSRRFIPAWAGNTGVSAASDPPIAVHPRMGGEHPQIPKVRNATHGSSPHGRGTRRARRAAPALHRFIPAWAGNTDLVTDTRRRMSVHPRMGGEHDPLFNLAFARFGSSPHGRGTPLGALARGSFVRFIPAWAGNTRARKKDTQ